MCAKCCNKTLIIIIIIIIIIITIFSSKFFNIQQTVIKYKVDVFCVLFSKDLHFSYIFLFLQHNPSWIYQIVPPSYIYMTLNWWVALCWVVLQFTKPAGCNKTTCSYICVCIYVCMRVCILPIVTGNELWKYPRQCSIIQKSCFIHPFASLNFMIFLPLLIRLPCWLHDPLNIHPFSHSCARCSKTTFDFLFSIFYTYGIQI